MAKILLMLQFVVAFTVGFRTELHRSYKTTQESLNGIQQTLSLALQFGISATGIMKKCDIS